MRRILCDVPSVSPVHPEPLPADAPSLPLQFAAFAAELPFALSAYQRQALQALAAAGADVLVVAPTGSGKSAIADAAIWQALQAGASAAYTSPLKALANQRFDQLASRWGERVGLLTGDAAIRPRAPVRVMTAEVYRTIALLPAEDEATAPLPMWAILDEAHYLADPQRGTAWEEAILATPAETRILCLSATIGAPERLAGWLRWLGRPVTLIKAAARPVPLRHYLFLRGDLHLVLDEHGRRAGSFPFAGGWAAAQRRAQAPRRGAGPRGRPAPIAGLPAVPPEEWTRAEALAALKVLRERSQAPVIAFTASRREAERLAAAARVAFPAHADGVAFHHAGLHPSARREVERRLRAGDLWLVCGTTTLAAGLDVPARSVLLTTFGRFDGREFSLFSPAEYRQVTGRAGRLGRDEAGSAVLLPSPWNSFEEAFRKLTAPLPPIESAFRPSYATALAWWSAGSDVPPVLPLAEREVRLATALATTFAAYLRRLQQRRGASPAVSSADMPPLAGPDDASLHQARALGRLLLADTLVDSGGRLTPRGRFVLHAGGGPEGRLFLRLLETGAFEALDDPGRADLLALLANGGAVPEQPDLAAAPALYAGAVRAQVAYERDAGAALTPPPSAQPPPPRPGSVDPWRLRASAADLLERTLRAAQRSRLPSSLATWGPSLLAQLLGDG